MGKDQNNNNSTAAPFFSEDGVVPLNKSKNENDDDDEPEEIDQFNENLLDNVFDPDNLKKKTRRSTIEVREEFKKKTWFSRTFSPLTPGSLRGSIISLSALALGTGVLALPKVATDCGILVGLFYLIGSAYIAYWSMMVMMKASFMSGELQYTKFTEKLLGLTYRKFLELAIIFIGFGGSIGYFITISKFVPQIINSFNYSFTDDPLLQRIIVILGSTIIIFPASIPKNLSILHNFIALGVFAVLYIILILIVQVPSYYQINFRLEDVSWIKFSLKLLPAFCVCCFSYGCQIIVSPIVAELKSPIERRISKIFSRSVILNMSVYIISMLAGFLSFPGSAPELITDRKAIDASDRDIAMNIGRLSMVIHLFTSIPLILLPSKNLLFNLSFLKNQKDNKLVYILVTFLQVYSSAGIAIIYPKIYEVLALLGGTCCVYMSIFLPGLLQIKMSEEAKSHWKNIMTYVFTIGATIFGLTAAFISFLKGISVMDF